MNTKAYTKQCKELLDPYRITGEKKFKLSDFNPSDTGAFEKGNKRKAADQLTSHLQMIAELQDQLYAQNRWAVLLIFQAMDAAGKDSAIKHVMSGVNPQGCNVISFKGPSSEELDHDFLWRCSVGLPARGRIGIFNRSYYEETLVVRVHKGILEGQRLPTELITKKIWKERFEDIRNYESYLSRNGVVIRKFFLNVSREEQKRRFLERIDRTEKNWKFAMGDVAEREHWDQYMAAYEETIQNTASTCAPWYVIPADHKWFTRLAVASAVLDCLASLNLAYPKLGEDKLKELATAKQVLENEEQTTL